jgi:Mitochondrial biogenesis AIM24
VRTWSRRTIWGDRLFLQFTGPTTILIQSRASRVRDVLTAREVNEIADTPPGTVKEAVRLALKKQSAETGGTGTGEKVEQTTIVRKPPKLSIASVQRDGKVRIEEADDFEGLKR